MPKLNKQVEPCYINNVHENGTMDNELNTLLKEVTIIYYNDHSMELMHEVKNFPQNGEGRVCIPQEYKEGKSILVICEGAINILNKFGERITAASNVLHSA